MHAAACSGSRCEGSRRRLEYGRSSGGRSAEEEAAAAAPASRPQSRAAHLHTRQVLVQSARSRFKPRLPPSLPPEASPQEEGLLLFLRHCRGSWLPSCLCSVDFCSPLVFCLPADTTFVLTLSPRLLPLHSALSVCAAAAASNHSSSSSRTPPGSRTALLKSAVRRSLLPGLSFSCSSCPSYTRPSTASFLSPPSRCCLLLLLLLRVYAHINARLLTPKLYAHLDSSSNSSSSNSSPNSRLLCKLSRSSRRTAADPPPTEPQVYVHLKPRDCLFRVRPQARKLLLSPRVFFRSPLPLSRRLSSPPFFAFAAAAAAAAMISLHQLFRVLSRVSVDPTSSLYAASLQAAEEGPPLGGPPSRGPPWAGSDTSTPVKVRSRSLSLDVGPLSTCTTTSQAQGPPSVMKLEPAKVEEAVCAKDSAPFRFSSNVPSSGTLDFEGPLGSAAVAAVLEVGPPSGGLRPRATCLSPQERLCSPTRTSSSGSSPVSSCASPSLLAAASADSASAFSLTSSEWASVPLLSEAAGVGGPPPRRAPHLAAGMQRHPWVQREPRPPFSNPANSSATCHQQRRLTAPFGAATAAGLQEEETSSEGPCGGGPHRVGIRHKRRHCRQQTPWDGCSSSRGSIKVAAAAVAQQSSEEGLLLGRRTAANSAPAAAAGAHDMNVEGGGTGAESRRSLRSRSTSLKGHLQQQQLLWQQQQGGEEEDLVAPACSSVTSRRSEMVASVGPGSGSGGVTSSSDSRLLGVCFSPPKDVWRARITVDGRQFEQQFSVKRHGFDGARLLATRWRAQMETARLSRGPTLPLP
ncbi:hypothetical protein Esti_001582 [Eimeria stiedai]